jgi:hypothetical protein
MEFTHLEKAASTIRLIHGRLADDDGDAQIKKSIEKLTEDLSGFEKYLE